MRFRAARLLALAIESSVALVARLAEAGVREDVLKRWRAAPEAGRIAYRNAAGQEVAIPLSFRGLTQALEALNKEPA